MNTKQAILKTIYPLLMKAGKIFGLKAGIKTIAGGAQPQSSVYALDATAINGKPIMLNDLRGKKILVVNTASDCGYTAQLDELQKLHELYKDNLVVLGFPANDFQGQEKGSNEDIATFCKANYGVSFPLMQKSVVVKTNSQNPVYNWLTHREQNGWNDKAPEWNFSKYLINEQGILTHYFGPAVSPLSNEVRQHL